MVQDVDVELSSAVDAKAELVMVLERVSGRSRKSRRAKDRKTHVIRGRVVRVLIPRAALVRSPGYRVIGRGHTRSVIVPSKSDMRIKRASA